MKTTVWAVLVVGILGHPLLAAPQLEWSRIWGSPGQDVAHDLAAAADGGVYVVGRTEGSFHGQSNPGNHCAFLTRYSFDGTHQWTRLFGPSTYSEATAVAVNSTGAVFVAGSTAAAFDEQQSIGDQDLFLCRYTPDGVREWTRIWGSTARDEVAGMAIDPDGRIETTWQNVTLVPRDTVVMAYVEYSGSVTAVSVAADWHSAPLLWEAVRVSSNEVTLSWPSVAGRTYEILATPDLLSTPPAPRASGILSTPPRNTYDDSAGGGPLFYQVRESW